MDSSLLDPVFASTIGGTISYDEYINHQRAGTGTYVPYETFGSMSPFEKVVHLFVDASFLAAPFVGAAAEAPAVSADFPPPDAAPAPEFPATSSTPSFSPASYIRAALPVILSRSHDRQFERNRNVRRIRQPNRPGYSGRGFPHGRIGSGVRRIPTACYPRHRPHASRPPVRRPR